MVHAYIHTCTWTWKAVVGRLLWLSTIISLTAYLSINMDRVLNITVLYLEHIYVSTREDFAMNITVLYLEHIHVSTWEDVAMKITVLYLEHIYPVCIHVGRFYHECCQFCILNTPLYPHGKILP